MRGPKPEVLTLSEKEQEDLEALVRQHSTPQQSGTARTHDPGSSRRQKKRRDRQRAGSQCGYGSQLAHALDRLAGSAALADLSVSERLEDIPRPGRPSQITAEQICQIDRPGL